MEIVGNCKEVLQKKNQTEIDFLILFRKAREKNLCYCCFRTQLLIEKKKVVYTPLLSYLHLPRRSKDVALALDGQVFLSCFE